MKKIWLIVGLGSIGSKHAELLLLEGNEVIAIDPDSRSYLKNQITVFKDLDDLSRSQSLDFKTIYAIVANWGPDHLSTVLELVAKGCSRILIEKPMGISPEDLQVLVGLVETGTNVLCNFPKRAAGAFEEVKNLLDEDGGCGQINVSGGAQCMSTNGIHWLDGAIEVFGNGPISTKADLSLNYINPRSDKLAFVEGSAIWSFGEGRRLSVSYTNSSSISGKAEFFGRNVLVTLTDDLSMKIYKRKPSELSLDNRVTRVGSAIKTGGKVFSIDRGIERLHSDLSEDSPAELHHKFNRDLVTHTALLAAFQSTLDPGFKVEAGPLERWNNFPHWEIS